MSSLLSQETKEALLDFLEEEIDSAAEKIVRLKDRQDHFAYGQLQVFLTFRRILSDTVTDELIEPPAQRTDIDRGFLVALGKTLFQFGLLDTDRLASCFESQLKPEDLAIAPPSSRAAQLQSKKPPKPQPVSEDIKTFVEAYINKAAQKIVDKKNHGFDHIANGQLGYLLTLRRWYEGTSTHEDLGLHDAINDVLQKAKIKTEGKTYLSALL